MLMENTIYPIEFIKAVPNKSTVIFIDAECHSVKGNLTVDTYEHTRFSICTTAKHSAAILAEYDNSFICVYRTPGVRTRDMKNMLNGYNIDISTMDYSLPQDVWDRLLVYLPNALKDFDDQYKKDNTSIKTMKCFPLGILPNGSYTDLCDVFGIDPNELVLEPSPSTNSIYVILPSF